jgi:hypothetical protein
MRLTVWAIAAFSLSQSPPALAQQSPTPPEQGFEQHRAHEHGAVSINLALEGNELVVELEAPAINVLGFERAPRDAAERAAAAAIESWLRSATAILGVPAAAACRKRAVEFNGPRWDDAAGHADYDVRFTYDCRTPAALSWAELWLLRRLKNITRVEANVLTATRQERVTLSGADTRVTLR